MRLVLISLFILSLCTINKDLIVCQTVCAQDGDEIGIIINSKCFCANSRDVSKVLVRVGNTRGKMIYSEEEKLKYIDF